MILRLRPARRFDRLRHPGMLLPPECLGSLLRRTGEGHCFFEQFVRLVEHAVDVLRVLDHAVEHLDPGTIADLARGQHPEDTLQQRRERLNHLQVRLEFAVEIGEINEHQVANGVRAVGVNPQARGQGQVVEPAGERLAHLLVHVGDRFIRAASGLLSVRGYFRLGEGVDERGLTHVLAAQHAAGDQFVPLGYFRPQHQGCRWTA